MRAPIITLILAFLLLMILWYIFPPKRYFFIGYDASSRKERNIGCFYYEGEDIIPIDSLRSVVYNRFKCVSDIKLEQCIITSIHEFDTKEEYLIFRGDSKGDYPQCQTK